MLFKHEKREKPKYTLEYWANIYKFIRLSFPALHQQRPIFLYTSWIFNPFLNYLSLSFPSKGIWKVLVKFQSNPQETFTADFEVKEYGRLFIAYTLVVCRFVLDWQCFFFYSDLSVLPSFEVKLKSVTPFFYVDDKQLTVNIQATYVKRSIGICCVLQSHMLLNMSRSWHCRYLFGEEVDGVAFVVFGIYSDGKTSIPSSLQRAQVSNIRILSFFSMVFNFCNVTSQQIKGGKGLATLKKENILQTFSTIEELVGNSIYVAVIVQTENGMLFFFFGGGWDFFYSYVCL